MGEESGELGKLDKNHNGNHNKNHENQDKNTNENLNENPNSLIQSIFLKQFKKANRWRQMHRQANTFDASYKKNRNYV